MSEELTFRNGGRIDVLSRSSQASHGLFAKIHCSYSPSLTSNSFVVGLSIRFVCVEFT